MRLRVLILVLGVSLVHARAVRAQVPSFDHVFVIVMENQEYDSIVGSASAPYINSLVQQYGLATNFFGVTHPSLPDYMALTSGDTYFVDDCVGCQTAAVNIADRLEAAGRTWTAYMEDMPAACTATDSGLYAAKHNPFVHYSDIVTNGARCASHVVPFSRFSSDLANGPLANYIWITPNLCNDMHDCSIATGDAWLSRVVPGILQSPAFTANSVLFLTWDEGVTNAGGGGHVPLVVVSPQTPAGLRVNTSSNHYSLLRTIEDAWGLAPLGQSAGATALSQFFTQPNTPPTDQIIYASDVTTLAGQWRKVSDPTAAAGVKLSTPDNAAATVDAPLANPANYFDATFQAAPATRYRVWMRMHATADSKFNDSVFVQFSDSVDASGRPIYRIATTGGYVVNLWTCATCQSFGWGWQRNAYWLSDSGDVWFPTGGTHTIRVQVREDGVEIDQIVISPVRYVDAAPGAVTNDTTIVPKGGAPPPPVGLPAPWLDQDVGSPALRGSATYASGTFTVKGAGADIWGPTDEFHFVDQSVSGDVQIVARVTSLQNTSPYAKAGLMLRGSTTASSAHVILDVRPTGDVEFMTRSADGAQTTYLAGSAQAAPAWLKLTRAGATVTGFVSSDGVTWRVVGSTSSALPANVLVGLVVNSHNAGALTQATFDSVTVGAAAPPPQIPAPWVDQDVGSPALRGSASYASGTFTIKGGGADIWGAADEFHFVDQPVSGDVQILARVAAVQNTSPYAKAGVMLRNSAAAGSAHVILDVRPTGDVEFMTRTADGAQTTYLAGAVQAAPAWLKLTRTGSVVTGYVSADGVTWRVVGSTTSGIAASALVGLVVNSHNTGALNTATFDNVGVQP